MLREHPLPSCAHLLGALGEEEREARVRWAEGVLKVIAYHGGSAALLAHPLLKTGRLGRCCIICAEDLSSRELLVVLAGLDRCQWRIHGLHGYVRGF